jgi:hypothetical protein
MFEKYDQLGGHISGKHNESARRQRVLSRIKERIFVFKICKKCGKLFKVKRTVNKEGLQHISKRERNYCSNQCSKSRQLTAETKLKISKSCTGKQSPRKGITTKIKVFKYCLNCKKQIKLNSKYGYCIHCIGNAKELCKKQSDILKEAYKNGRKIYGGNRAKWYKYKDIKVQGTFELRACYILDAMKLAGLIKDWNYTNDRIKYFDENNKQRSYLFDFKLINLDNSINYIEVKGYIKSLDKIKWKAAEEQNYILKVWQFKELKQYENQFNIKRFKLIKRSLKSRIE